MTWSHGMWWGGLMRLGLLAILVWTLVATNRLVLTAWERVTLIGQPRLLPKPESAPWCQILKSGE